MIARSAALAPDTTMTPRSVPDPRRAYDRGAWSDADVPEQDGDDEADEELASDDAGPLDLARLSTAEIVAELRRREGRLGRLVERRRRLAAQLAELEREIRELSEEPVALPAPPRRVPDRPRVSRPRPQNSLSLADALAAEIETDETVGPSDAARRVLRNGYQTNAKNFTLLVNGTLRKDDRFVRVARGNYRRLSSSEVEERRRASA